MARPNLEVKASTTQESPDIVILGGHSHPQYLSAGGGNYADTFFGYAQRIQGLGSIFV